MKIHKMDTRLFVNAGMRFPACQANAKLLDCDKSRWKLSNADFDCLKCLAILNKAIRGEE